MDKILEMNNISIAFGGLQALSNVSFSVMKGDILGIIGPNGAGKTVLLNCINGVYTPDQGEVLFKGRPIIGLPRHKIASLGIGRTFQHSELFQRMTVIGNTLLGRHGYLKTNIFSGGLFWGPGRREELKARKNAEKVLDFLDLYIYRKEKVSDLPFGVQKIVGLARALAGEPTLLLVDELGSGLMREEKEDVARFLLRIHYESGTTIIWIEHDMQLVTDICSRLICLDFGTKIKEGTPQEVISDPKVIEAYVGRSH
ncbi:MAG: ABC transporter ATP-binding protein [Thermodesulfobacteriota bacterium]|nr:ABC transporter ATP-binding protein [Thermodesulfobacteriota bacterium]